jgi:hypothetical protein
MTMRITVQRFLPVAVMAAFIAACADAPTSAVGFTPSLPNLDLGSIATPPPEELVLCKAGPVGTYTFNATATHPVLRNAATGANDLTTATYTIVVSAGSTINVGGSVVPGACYAFTNTSGSHNHIAVASGSINATVTVVETGIPAGIDFDHVVVYQNTAGVVSTTSSTTNSASGHLGGIAVGQSLGASITFYNVLEPTTGCTYTKGWYQNPNGAPTVTAVDGRTKTEAQTILASTPSPNPAKNLGVTWGSDNLLHNLYQQLLTALLNGGASGPADVQTAITDAQNGTGGTGLNITTTLTHDEMAALVATLTAFNEGTYPGWPHCAD